MSPSRVQPWVPHAADVRFDSPVQPCVSHSPHRRNQERFSKNAGERTGRVEISKEEILAVSVACKATF